MGRRQREAGLHVRPRGGGHSSSETEDDIDGVPPFLELEFGLDSDWICSIRGPVTGSESVDEWRAARYGSLVEEVEEEEEENVRILRPVENPRSSRESRRRIRWTS